MIWRTRNLHQSGPVVQIKSKLDCIIFSSICRYLNMYWDLLLHRKINWTDHYNFIEKVTQIHISTFHKTRGFITMLNCTTDIGLFTELENKFFSTNTWEISESSQNHWKVYTSLLEFQGLDNGKCTDIYVYMYIKMTSTCFKTFKSRKEYRRVRVTSFLMINCTSWFIPTSCQKRSLHMIQNLWKAKENLYSLNWDILEWKV